LVVDLGVKDGHDFIFDFTVDVDWSWQRLGMIWNGVQSCRFQLGDIEDWVNGAEVVQKPQGD
jgi:hypothetical protein